MELSELRRANRIKRHGQNDSETHLRSAAKVTGYRLEGANQPAGSIEDFLIDDGTWLIKHLVVNTGRWLPGKRVLVAPARIRSLDWIRRTVAVDLPGEALKAGRA